MHLKSEFRKRLINLECTINNLLIADSFDKAETEDLLHSLDFVNRYLWSFGNKSLLKK